MKTKVYLEIEDKVYEDFKKKLAECGVSATQILSCAMRSFSEEFVVQNGLYLIGNVALGKNPVGRPITKRKKEEAPKDPFHFDAQNENWWKKDFTGWTYEHFLKYMSRWTPVPTTGSKLLQLETLGLDGRDLEEFIFEQFMLCRDQFPDGEREFRQEYWKRVDHWAWMFASINHFDWAWWNQDDPDLQPKLAQLFYDCEDMYNSNPHKKEEK